MSESYYLINIDCKHLKLKRKALRLLHWEVCFIIPQRVHVGVHILVLGDKNGKFCQTSSKLHLEADLALANLENDVGVALAADQVLVLLHLS